MEAHPHIDAEVHCPVKGCDWSIRVSEHTSNTGIVMAGNDMEIHLRKHAVDDLVSVVVALALAKEGAIDEVVKSLENWKGQPARTRHVNEERYMMVEVSIVAIQELIDLLEEAKQGIVRSGLG